MQYFVIGVSVGGFHLTEKAAKYLDSLDGGTKIQEKFEEFGGDYWCNFDRTILIEPMKKLEYEYDKLDELNEGCCLRLVKVPDNVNCYIRGDNEYGIESVDELSRSWTVSSDYYERALYHIEKFGKNLTDVSYIDESIKYFEDKENGLSYAYDNHYCVAKFMDVLVFLKRVSYYRETENHPRVYYKIFDNEDTIYSNSNDSKFVLLKTFQKITKLVEVVNNGKQDN